MQEKLEESGKPGEPTFSHDTYVSPFTWRYGSEEMRRIWSETHKRKLLRRVWIALAKAEERAGIVSREQVEDLEAHKDDIDIRRASEIEAEIRHDLMAEIKTFAEQCPKGGSIIHLGATSMDALDNMDALRLKEALRIIIKQVMTLLELLRGLISRYAETPCMAFTHIQPAEPTTVGYRLSLYAQDLCRDLEELHRASSHIRGKGMKGAVGSSASYTELLRGTEMSAEDLDRFVMNELGLKSFTAATQVYPRKQDWFVVNALSGTAASIYKMAFDLRILQSPPFGEWSEPFGKKQVGSSAMPFKRNPIRSEKIDSLARYIASLPGVMWNNAAHSLLERTLDDSSNRREVLPSAFLAMDEVLKSALQIFGDIRFHEPGITRNLEVYGTFAATERLLMELGRRGADRQEMHEVIREHSLNAWAQLQETGENSLSRHLAEDERIISYISHQEVLDILDASVYIGDASIRAKKIIQEIEETLRSVSSR